MSWSVQEDINDFIAGSKLHTQHKHSYRPSIYLSRSRDKIMQHPFFHRFVQAFGSLHEIKFGEASGHIARISVKSRIIHIRVLCRAGWHMFTQQIQVCQVMVLLDKKSCFISLQDMLVNKFGLIQLFTSIQFK